VEFQLHGSTLTTDPDIERSIHPYPEPGPKRGSNFHTSKDETKTRQQGANGEIGKEEGRKKRVLSILAST
jgi:hypothetical protein